MPGVSIAQYLGGIALQNGIPIPEAVAGAVYAELYRGLWIVRCPASDCSSAATVTSVNPVYFCPDCGIGWFGVVFPGNKAAIQNEVMKRPATRKGLIHANWRRGETMKQLQRETVAQANV